MNIDDRIKQELESERAAASTEVDSVLSDNRGVFNMLQASYRGGMRRWIAIVLTLTFVVSGILFWSGYNFFVATNIADQLFWGIVMLLSLSIQIAAKMWMWMEINRSSTVREIKRLELAVVQLESKLKSNNQ